jgi:flagellar basal-body rod modification protein FlgD
MTIQGITPDASSGVKAASSAGSGNSSKQTADGGLDTTFLNLLITELQTQDPTAPMDSTQMVGQMVSLNQLDQLIAIHQLLEPSSGASTTPSAVQGGK